MELRHIRYFMAVANELNFTQAAAKLCIAQPPLSRQIQDLEEELGAKLFIRKPHALQLTEEGAQFKQYAVQVLDLVEKSAADIREMKKGLQGMLYLASVEGHGTCQLSEWIAGFQHLYPHVQYNLWNGNSEEIIYRVMQGLCDLAIVVEPYNAEGLDALHIYEEPWIAMIPCQHPLAEKQGDTIDAAELAPYDLIVPSRKSRVQEIGRWLESSGAELTVRCQIAHVTSAYELTKQGVGIAIYPASASKVAMKDTVCIKRIVNPSVMASYVLIWNKNRQLPHAAQKFLEYVRQSVPFTAV